MRVLLMQIRREFWEHRSLWIAPLLVAILLLAGVATFSRVQFFFGAPRTATVPPLVLMLFGWGIPFYLAAGIVVVVYLLDCLYGERRDRSILFWRSMPVSDTQTVLAKLLVGLVIVPLATFLLAAATSLLASGILALRHHVQVNNGLPPAWNAFTWLHTQIVMLYGLVALLLWYAPYATYLMLASVWAKRSPYAWAFVPPVLLAIFEYMLFGTNYLGRIVERGFYQLVRLAFSLNLQLAFSFGEMVAPPPDGRGPPRTGQQPMGASGLLESPQLWLGLAAAALMVVLAIRLRRYRDDS
jgi:ABC-2 type transport system permease protein